MAASAHFTAAAALMTTLLFSSKQAAAAVRAETNKALLGPLCELLSLPTGAAGLEEEPYKAESSYHNLQDMNLTLSASEWRQLFAKQEPSGARPTKPKAPHDNDEARLEHWQDWLDSADRLEEPAAERQILQKANLENAGKHKKVAVLAALQPILKKAYVYNKQLKLLTAADGANSTQAIKKLVNDATYGEGVGTLSEITQTSTTGTKAVDAVSTACGTATASAQVKTTAGIAVCLCGKAKSSGVDQVCSKGQATEPTINDNFDNVGEVAKTVLDLCVGMSAQPLTADKIRSAIRTILAQLNIDRQRTYLGEYTTTGCSGQAGSGECVIYHGSATAAKTAIQNSEWYAKLTTAADLLEKKQMRNTQIKTLNQLLEAEEQLAYSLALQMQLSPTDVATPASTAKAATNSKSTENKVNCNAASNKTAEECTKLGCDHDAATNKCEPKPGTETPAAGTGEGATAAATEKCKGKLEPDCTKAPGCKWEGTECRDSSFLLNKQFALSVVSAAFVALLF